jgi:hypothetical protein
MRGPDPYRNRVFRSQRDISATDNDANHALFNCIINRLHKGSPTRQRLRAAETSLYKRAPGGAHPLACRRIGGQAPNVPGQARRITRPDRKAASGVLD